MINNNPNPTLVRVLNDHNLIFAGSLSMSIVLGIQEGRTFSEFLETTAAGIIAGKIASFIGDYIQYRLNDNSRLGRFLNKSATGFCIGMAIAKVGFLNHLPPSSSLEILKRTL